MVRMFLLKRSGDHGIAVSTAAVDPSYRRPPTPTTISTIQFSLLVIASMGTPRRRWEKGSTPKKNHPPSPCMTRHPKRRRRAQPSPAPPSYTIHYRYCSRFLIQWLYLRHCFVTASLCCATPYDTILPLHFPIDLSLIHI